MIPTQPNICLLCNGRIKVPPTAIFPKKLRKISWIAISLTKFVRDWVLAWKMENINRQTNLFESGSFFTCLASEQLLSKKMWLGSWPFIQNVLLINSYKSSRCVKQNAKEWKITYNTTWYGLGTIKCLPHKNYPIWSNNDLLIVCPLPSKLCLESLLDLQLRKVGCFCWSSWPNTLISVDQKLFFYYFFINYIIQPPFLYNAIDRMGNMRTLQSLLQLKSWLSTHFT